MKDDGKPRTIKQIQIEEIETRISKKRLGAVGSQDVSVLTLLEIGDLLEESNRLLRIIAKEPEAEIKKKWYHLF